MIALYMGLAATIQHHHQQFAFVNKATKEAIVLAVSKVVHFLLPEESNYRGLFLTHGI